jgi:hypothetical protein
MKTTDKSPMATLTLEALRDIHCALTSAADVIDDEEYPETMESIGTAMGLVASAIRAAR